MSLLFEDGRHPSSAPLLVHATAVAVQGRAALFLGPSGSGKSDLALRCLLHPVSPLLPVPALLVADDQVLLTREGSRLLAAGPVNLYGRMEVRGLGVLTLPSPLVTGTAQVVLAVTLVRTGEGVRFPDPPQEAEFLGLRIPMIGLAAFEASAAAKALLALRPELFQDPNVAG